MALNIVLIEPEIPQNTGNIVRTCAATGAVLHLVGPLGFSIEDRYLKRAGLDYWNEVTIKYYDGIEEFLKQHGGGRLYFSTTKAVHNYCDIEYEEDCFILFGKETAGLPEELLKENQDTCIRIPMNEGIRYIIMGVTPDFIMLQKRRPSNGSLDRL